MTLPLPETAEGSLALEAKSRIIEAVERTKSVLAIGPGLSQHPETVALVHSLICASDAPTVIDADGINALSKSKEILSSLSSQTVLTPHPGEMARLIGGTVESLERDRIGIAQRFAQAHNVTLVLKGAPTVVARGNGEVWINSTRKCRYGDRRHGRCANRTHCRLDGGKKFLPLMPPCWASTSTDLQGTLSQNRLECTD